ncbi:MAG: aminoglycoside phosphotransferase family protein [Clostridia bacterium]|nr:aminoglycoside phosphotransferase family protein [Clostridia bacterium]MBQ3870156.1 aminoglycoside phosphotransferase family protein [Clostridia bacterium]
MELSQICRKFGLNGKYIGATLLKSGNINKTYKVDFDNNGRTDSYIIQKINTYVFKKPEHIMANIEGVTRHIAAKLPDCKRERGVLSFLYTEENKNYYVDEEGGFWRGYGFIPNSITYDAFDTGLLRAAGEAFGEFQLLLADYDASSLYEIIPDFHNTKARYRVFEEKVLKDEYKRVDGVREEVDFLFKVRPIGEALVNMLESGELPLRVTHNDTKGNNILFDIDTNETLAVIDLDTVMPGLMAYDFGDAVRFAANTSAEDEPDISKTSLDLEKFEAFSEGYVGKIKNTSTENELKTLVTGALVMTIELAVRFLDDYIDGDKYFKLNYPEHNLVRTRCQIALIKDMLKKRGVMDRIIEKYI